MCIDIWSRYIAKNSLPNIQSQLIQPSLRNACWFNTVTSRFMAAMFGGLDEMKELKEDDMLYKLVITSEDESIKILRQQVARLGISETTIFPDLGGLGRELSLEYDLSPQ